jgi:ATP-dependent DNA helicase RecG
MSPLKEIHQLISAGESEKVEFKQGFNDEVIESIVAFANTSGGSVFIGVSDTGKITGASIGKETLQNWTNEIKNKTSPAQVVDITDHEIDGKVICQIRANEFPVKPVSFKGRYFKRVKNSNHQLSVHEISEIHLQSLQLSWDSYPYPNATVDDLDFDKVRLFITKVNNSGRFILPEKVEDALNKLRLIVDDVPVNAAMLLFAKEGLNHNVHVGRLKTPSMILMIKFTGAACLKLSKKPCVTLSGKSKLLLKLQARQRSELKSLNTRYPPYVSLC